MISKITATNGESFYKPAFDLINAAVAEQKTKRSDSNASYLNIPEIKSIEDYFNNLTAIRELWVNLEQDEDSIVGGDIGGYLLLMPADEEIFKINANTREISIPAAVKKNGIGVLGDHFAEMIVLQIDRYFDNQDLLKAKCAINWNFTAAGERQPRYGSIQDGVFVPEPKAEEAFVPNADINPEFVTFGFIINKEMTPSKGVLTFSVTFYDTDSSEISYSFNTLTASVNINDTLTLKDPALVKTSNNSNFLGRLSNSVYSDSTLSPVSNPVWQMNGFDEDTGKYSGLPSLVYLDSSVDGTQNYESGNGVMLRTYASVSPSTADIYYRWVYTPINGNVTSTREKTTETRVSDYIEVALPAEGNLPEGKYYLLNDQGRVETHSVTFGDETSENHIVVTNPMSSDDVAALKAMVAAINEDENQEDIEMPKIYVFGSSFEALYAGEYRVFAQGHLGTGTYTEVLPDAELKAGVNYYVKDSNDNIDAINPVRNDDAIRARDEEGKTLYVFTGGSSNSAEVYSNICKMPPAVEPIVSLSVTSDYPFDENIVKSDDEADIAQNYTYIDANNKPALEVSVDFAEGTNSDDKAGWFAVQLISDETPALTTEAEVEALINDPNNEIRFCQLPESGKFISVTNSDALGDGKFLINDMDEGTYMVRVFNRRNGTYSVANSSSSITTSYVASAIRDIDVVGLVDGNNIAVISGGDRPVIDGVPTFVNLEISRTRPEIEFVMTDNSDYSSNDIRSDAVSYSIEEVDIVESDEGQIIVPRNESGKDNEGRSYESAGEKDLREITKDDEDHYTFTIREDPGYYRIKIVNKYNGTLCTSYTDIFGIITH